jgi:hypothetical protein
MADAGLGVACESGRLGNILCLGDEGENLINVDIHEYSPYDRY